MNKAKKILAGITLAALIVLQTDCAKKERERDFEDANDEKIYVSITDTGSVGNQYMLINTNEMMKYVDFSSENLEVRPFCLKPNCAHNDNNCVAYSLRSGLGVCPFFYRDSFYYFNSDDGLYRADMDGTNQALIFKFDSFRNIGSVNFFNGNLLFCVYEEEISDDSHGRNYRVYAYDFSKFRLVYETGMKYDSSVSPIGIIGDALYFTYRGRDYPIEVTDDLTYYELFTDKDSVYYKDYVVETRKIALDQTSPKNPDYEVIADDIYLIAGDYYYCAGDNEKPSELYKTNKVNGITGETETIEIPVGLLYGFDGTLIVRANKILENGEIDYLDYLWSYYDGSDFVKIENSDNFSYYGETEDYVIGYIADYNNSEGTLTKVCILKSDFYNGNFDVKLTIPD